MCYVFVKFDLMTLQCWGKQDGCMTFKVNVRFPGPWMVKTILIHTLCRLCTKPVLRDHCHERPPVLKNHYFWQKLRHFNVNEPLTSMTRETIFLWPMEWSSKTGSTVSCV